MEDWYSLGANGVIGDTGATGAGLNTAGGIEDTGAGCDVGFGVVFTDDGEVGSPVSGGGEPWGRLNSLTKSSMFD